jgi:hypothetical protein
MVINAALNIISAISWRSVVMVVETGVLGEHYRPASSHFEIDKQTNIFCTPISSLFITDRNDIA